MGDWLYLAGGIAAGVLLILIFIFTAWAKFLKRPSPSEAIIRIGQRATEVFIGRSAWIFPILHRAATISLSTIGLTIRRASHEALVSKDFISTNLAAEFYIRVEPNDDDVKKAARTIGIDEGHASSEAIRIKAQQLLEPKLVGAIRAVAAQNDFLQLHLNREHFAQEIGKALREDLGRNGFTLESVTITELTQTPLSELRRDDIFGASGFETVQNTVIAKDIAVRKKAQEGAERSAEIQKEQEIKVAQQNRMLREGKAKEEEAAAKAEIAKNEAIEARDLQRQAFIALERAKKEQQELAAEIAKQKTVEAAQVDKEKTIEASLVDKQITLTMKAKESAEADAEKAAALALREKADQEVITVKVVSEAERSKKVAIVSAEKDSEQEKIRADVTAYQKRVEAEGQANAVRAGSEGRADAARVEAQGTADAVKIKAKAEADAAEMQALAITKLAEARREAGLKEAEVERQKVAAVNAKSPEILLAEIAYALIQKAPEIVRELVKPAERIGEIKVLQLGGLGGGMGAGALGGDGATAGGSTSPGLGTSLGPVAKTILETSAVMPLVQQLLKFADVGTLKDAVSRVAPGFEKPLEALVSPVEPRVGKVKPTSAQPIPPNPGR